MGRGSSKAGGGGGGGAQKQAPPQPTQTLTPPSPADVAMGNILPQGGVPFSDFENMTDDEKAQVINDALNTGVPLFLDDSGIQRFTYFTGMSDTPNVVSDSQLDAMGGHELFRTVNDAYNRQKDIGYSAHDIAQQITDGDFTMYSDSGGSAYGKAIYFASSVGSSSGYAQVGKNPTMMRAKITGGKSISDTQATRDYQSALARGDKLARACSRADGSSARNLYTLAKGYDVITTGDYHMVLNRRCLTVSSKLKTGVSWGTNKW